MTRHHLLQDDAHFLQTFVVLHVVLDQLATGHSLVTALEETCAFASEDHVRLLHCPLSNLLWVVRSVETSGNKD